MNKLVLALSLTVAALPLAACSKSDGGNAAASGQTGNAKDVAGKKTIAAGLDQNSSFFKAAKAAGFDATLAGPGPYTVLAPNDAAFAKLPAGTADNLKKPEQKAQLTQLLTYHILSGTVLADDIGKAVDAAKGTAQIATIGGQTLTATRENGRIVLADASGNKATVVAADQQFSNGVVHGIDGVLMPKPAGAPPAGR